MIVCRRSLRFDQHSGKHFPTSFRSVITSCENLPSLDEWTCIHISSKVKKIPSNFFFVIANFKLFLGVALSPLSSQCSRNWKELCRSKKFAIFFFYLRLHRAEMSGKLTRKRAIWVVLLARKHLERTKKPESTYFQRAS